MRLPPFPPWRRLAAVVPLMALASCAATSPTQVVHVASGLTSQMLCSEAFLSGVAPARAFDEVLRPMMGMPPPFLRYTVDERERSVTTRVAGLFESRAVFVEGWGCVLERGGSAALEPFPADVLRDRQQSAPLLADVAGAQLVPGDSPALRAAVLRAFDEAPQAPFNRTRAVVVMQHGRVIAEHYAPGFGVDTPLHGWSMTKSVFAALAGVLVRQGRLSADESDLFAEWRSPGDPRRAVTVRQLLRQTAGVGGEQTNTGWDASSRMKFVERDMAAYALAQPLRWAPGTAWDYSDANYVLLSRLLQQRVGGGSAEFARFAQRELFGPLGMRHVTLERDASGLTMGAAYMYAPAREWARLGQLYLQDGVAGNRRLLPEGWVRDAATPSAGTGYGEGFFTNRMKGGEISNWGIGWELPYAPDEAYFARGIMGQYVIVVPSQQLVVVRMGPSQQSDGSLQSTGRLVADVIAALQPAPAPVAAAAATDAAGPR